MTQGLTKQIPLDDDSALSSNSPYVAPTQKAVKGYVDSLETLLSSSLDELLSGWLSFSSTLTYSSASSPSFVLSAPTDLTGVLSPGMRMKLNQSQALTAYWSFDTNSNSNVGSFNGTDTAMSYTSGKFSNAATFNGTTSKIVITDNSSLKPTGEFTIGVWIKTSVTGSDRGIFQSYSANTNIAGIALRINTSNTLRINVGKNTGTTLNTDYMDFAGTTNVCDNNWHYLVVTFRNNYLQAYVDGNLEIQGYCVTPAYAATNYVRIGCLNFTGADSNFMSGQIDDLFLINGYAVDETWIRTKYILATAQGTGSLSLDKYFLITSVGDYSGGVTLVTLYGGTDYSLANSTITTPKYSMLKSPQGFPQSPRKWTVTLSSSVSISQASPTANVWYNLLSLSIPVGVWNMHIKGRLSGVHAGVTAMGIRTTLSTGSSTETNTESTINAALTLTTATVNDYGFFFSHRFVISLRSATTHYLNVFTSSTGLTSLGFRGDTTATLVTATSAYL